VSTPPELLDLEVKGPYEVGGIAAGEPGAGFTYRVTYTDADGDEPTPGYPKLHILKRSEDGEFEETHVCVMDFERWINEDEEGHESGSVYSWTQRLDDEGYYEFYIEAKDIHGKASREARGKGPIVSKIIPNKLSFHPGWNLISLPCTPLQAFTAKTLLEEIDSQGGTPTLIQRWDGTDWITYKLDLPKELQEELNFDIEIGVGYFVYCDTSSEMEYMGHEVESQVIEFDAGWKLIGLPVINTDVSYSAESFGDEVNAQGGECRIIQTWYAGMWKTHSINLPFGDYELRGGKGYFVKCGVSSTWSYGQER
jgi:hypothetical protein